MLGVQFRASCNIVTFVTRAHVFQREPARPGAGRQGRGAGGGAGRGGRGSGAARTRPQPQPQSPLPPHRAAAAGQAEER